MRQPRLVAAPPLAASKQQRGPRLVRQRVALLLRAPIVWPVHETSLHRHGGFEHSHPYAGPHRHWLRGWRRSLSVHDHAHEHGHSHGLVHDSIKRSGEGVRAVVLSLAVLAATAIVQGVVFIASGSVALLADLIHNGGDALTALPLGAAFAMRSRRAEGYAGLAVVAAIFISALVAGAESIRRLIDPSPPTDLWVLAAAGAIGYLGNWIAAQIRTRAGQRLESPALIADGNHARADAYVSLAVVAAAAAVAVGVPILDPIIGMLITVAILRITWASWLTVRDDARGAAQDHRH
jgi:Co/Zn/Cd efflux system component